MVLAMAYARPEINRVSPVPIYRQLFDAISGQIRDGRLRPGEKLPSERDLADDLEIGYQTVRRVMGMLREAGLIISSPGKGTFVVAPGHNKGT